jgi:AcrR family transcriptional regulator
MPRKGTGRQELLDAVVDQIRDKGLDPDASLGGIAAAIGTSRQLLSHHFDTKDKLLKEAFIVLRLRDLPMVVGAGPQVDRRTALTAMWRHYADPAAWPANAATYTLIGRAVNDPAGFRDLVESLIAWEAVYASLAEAEGLDPASAEAEALLVVSAVRGLLLDLLLTGRRDVADTAFGRLLAAIGAPDQRRVRRAVG